MQDTGKFRTNAADKFYTKDAVAKACVDKLISTCPSVVGGSWLWIEPSAGGGAFLRAMPPGVRHVGVDIEPGGPGIVQADFLNWSAPAAEQQRKVIIGNPPFGRQGSLAKKFIMRACSSVGADIVAFVLPRSFVKPSMSRAFPLRFHCLLSEELAANSFEVNGLSHDVPCVFQIWERREVDRQVEIGEEPEGFEYVGAGATAGAEAHIAFRRVGVNAGRCFLMGEGAFSAQSHYFLRVNEKYVAAGLLELVVATVNEIEFPSNTVGPRSLSKGEVNKVLNKVLVEVDDLL
jgi:hypothetical protein